MPTRDEVTDAIMSGLRELSPKSHKVPVTGETNLIQSGLVDSFGFLELISKLEARFSVALDVSAYDFETFTTVAGLAEAVLSQAAAT